MEILQIQANLGSYLYAKSLQIFSCQIKISLITYIFILSKSTIIMSNNTPVSLSAEDEDEITGSFSIQPPSTYKLKITDIAIIVLSILIVLTFFIPLSSDQSPKTQNLTTKDPSEFQRSPLQNEQHPNNNVGNNLQQTKLNKENQQPIHEQHSQNHQNDQKQQIPEFRGECISKEYCVPRKQITNADYKLLKKYKVPFYSLKKFEEPLEPPLPQQYFNISLVAAYQQLPLCVIVVDEDSQSSHKFRSIKESIDSQGYKNYDIHPDNRIMVSLDLTVLKLQHFISFSCPEKSVVVLAENPFRSGSLKELNKIYQQTSTWLTFHQKQFKYNQKNKATHGITSFYQKFIQLVKFNEVKLTNPRAFDDLYVAMIQIGYSHAHQLDHQFLFTDDKSTKNNLGHIHQTFNPNNYELIKYRSATYLSSNYYLDKMEPLLINYIKVMQQKEDGHKAEEGTHLTQFDILRNLQNVGLKDLPKEHLLFDRQSEYLERKHRLSQITEQKRMCVVMLSFNNIEGDRYKYAIDTVFMQNYTNFHIVFIDDASTDQTLNQTKKRVQKMGYDENKISYVRNEEKMYATFNIKNAGDNYCKTGEVLVLIDGDDQVVGVNALKILNIGYVKHNKWIVYSSYFSTSLTYGGSKDPDPSFWTDQIRLRYYIIGPIRSFYVDLFRMIKEEDHKDDEGNFFPNYYDGALQYPLFEMSGPQKIMYIPEVSYLYTISYHGSDSKSQQHPRKIYQNMVYARPRYKRVSEQQYMKVSNEK